MSTTSKASSDRVEQRKMLIEWNDTKKDYPIDQCLHQLIEQQVERTPDAIALVFGEQALTYRELNRRANQLAHHLRALGVGPDLLIGVCVERSLEMVVALVGVLKAGGAYVPLDPEYPKDRLAFMIQDADVPVLLTQKHLVANLPAHKARVICLDTDWDQMAGESPSNLACITRPDQLAYMIYTSGSTGKPKGAKNHHRGICNRLLWMQDEYRLSGTDTVMQKTPFSFDVSVWEFFWPLMTGARLVVARPGGHRDPAYLVDVIEQQSITVLHFVPSMLQIFLDEPEVERCASLRHVICSGEALPFELQEKFFARLSADLHNLYGPTEAAVDVTYWKCQRASTIRVVPIGRPVANTQCYVLDAALQPVPLGETGELHLGGVQIGYGYHNRPELTAEKFIPDPFRSEPGARLYKTGDLARYLPDGAIEYLGRIDHQVKIRGFRIELGEIESCLRKQPGVRDCVVVAREDQPGAKRLVAYLVAADATSAAVPALRAALQRELPEYMVPAAFVTLEALPLSPNGKIDRKALPAPLPGRPASAGEYMAPPTPEEALLADIWSQVLHVSPVGVQDSFFDLGGDSIRAIQMLARARHKGLHFSLEQLFREQTIARLVAGAREPAAGSSQRSALQPFALLAAEDRARLPEGLEDAYPLVALQAGMHFVCDLNPGSAVFHDIFSFEIGAAFDAAKLQAALQRLVLRHAPLRTTFDFGRYSEPLQFVHPQARAGLTVEDLRHLSGPQQQEALRAWFEAEKRRPFKWDEAPLARFHVQRHAEERFQLIVSFHHIVLDGWSLAVLVTQLLQDYFALLDGSSAGVAPLRTSYREYVALEKRAAASEHDRLFWKEKLSDPTVSSVPRWPAALCKGGPEQVRGPEIEVPADVLAGLRSIAQTAGVPLRTVLLAAHMKVMSTIYGSPDVISGLITNGRQEELDAERMVGLFLNALPFRMKLGGGSWLELCRQTFAAEQAILPYRRFPLVEAQRLAGGQSLFETSFDFVNWHVYRELEAHPGRSFREGDYFEAENFTLSCTFALDSTGSALQYHFDYDPAQLAEEQIREYTGYYLTTLAAMAADRAARYDAFSPLSAAEKRTLLEHWSGAAVAGSANERCFHESIEEQASRTPDAPAVAGAGHSLSYAMLDRRANQLAHRLRKRGIGPDVLVGLCVSRTPEMIVALLGILKAGGAYVPLDPDYPAERLAFMLSDCGAKAIVTEASQASALPPLPAGCEAIFLDREAQAIAAERDDRLPPAAGPSNLAYAIYTSGSTGRPKAALLTHRGVCNLASCEPGLFGIGPRSRVLQFASLSFDASVEEIALALCSGGTLYVEDRDRLMPGPDLERYLEQEKITVLSLTPSTLAMLDPACTPSLKVVIVSGEACPAELAERWAGRCRFFNTYGPTEASVDTTYSEYRDGLQPPIIGRPLPNVRVYLLDRARAPVPVGVAGELYIGGAGVARGYLNRPSLTAERFVPDPFCGAPGALMYRSGDFARWRPDGQIEFIGRIDDQVKLRGFRIELGEIEAALARHPGVQTCAVLVRSDSQGERRLVAYLAPRNGEAPATSELREHLRRSLPDHMVPATFVSMDALPLTPSDKVDRKALPEPEAVPAGPAAAQVAPRTPMESVLAGIWCDVLGLKQIGIRNDFFESGGHSLLAAQVISRVRHELDVEIALRALFESPTIERLAESLLRQSPDRAQLEKGAELLMQVAQLSDSEVEAMLAVSAE